MNKTNLFWCILFITLVFGTGTSFAIKPPIKFGEVSIDELKMKVYEADTSVSAVILCDYGYFDPDNFKFTQITRIKILKKSGYVWANKTFPAARNSFVQGITYNLVNEQVVESKLEAKSIYTETIYKEMERIRVAMPDVKVGSVIDILFVGSGFPEVWEFQQEIPVKYSELILYQNPHISFRKRFFGFEKLKLDEEGHWIAENMPAFKPEPFISSVKNYLTRIDFDIYEVSIGKLYMGYNKTWEELCKMLDENNHFGVPLRSDSHMNEAVKEILLKAKTDKDKLRLAHEYLKTHKWDNYETIYTSNSNLKWALDKKSGNSADINLALVQLLKKLGFKVTPVLMSTRDNGFISPVYPSADKLNYVIAKIDLNGDQILMDATEEYAPWDLLPERCLNFFGRSFDVVYSETVELTTNKKDKETISYDLVLDDELQFSGKLQFLRMDYAALDFRNEFNSFPGKDSYLESMLQHYPGLRIKNAIIDNIDSIYLPVKDQYQIILKNALDAVGENIYIYPMMLHKQSENPFKSDQRLYPVDFIHKSEKTLSVTIRLPDNVEVTSVPKAEKIGLPNNSAYFIYQVTILDNTIQFNYKMMINKTVFGEDEYKDVKELYNQIIAKHGEPIILKRK